MRRDCSRAVREVRLSLGAYSLAMVMERMRDEILAVSAITSVRRTYVPSWMRFGLHPVDYRRWGQFSAALAEELTGVMVEEIKKRSLVLAGGDL